MASSALLEALLGESYKASDNPYGISALGIAGAAPKLINPYDDPTANLGAAIGSTLLASILASSAKSEAAQQNAELYKQFGTLRGLDAGGRDALVAKYPKLARAATALQLQEAEAAADLAKLRQQKAIDLEFEQKALPFDLEKTALEKTAAAKIDALAKQGIFYTPDGKTQKAFDPADVERNAAIAKKEGEIAALGFDPAIRTEEDSARKEIGDLPSAKQFLSMQKAVPILENYANTDTRSADIGFIYNYIKGLDEGAVRGEEINLASTANPILQKWAATLDSAFSGKSQLTPALKTAMLEELKAARRDVYAAAVADAKQRLAIATSRGASQLASLPFPLDLDFSGGVKVAPITDGAPVDPSVPPGMALVRDPATGEVKTIPLSELGQ